MEGTPTLSEAPAVHRLDGTLRMLIWGALLYVAVQQLSQGGSVSPVSYIVPLALFLALTAGLLLASVPGLAYRLRQSRDMQPLLMASLPLLLIVPYVLLTRGEPDFDPSTILITGMAVFLPVSCAILNVPALRRSDITLGLITVLVPLLAPLVQTRELTQLWLRVGAFALPVLLLLLSTRNQKQRLNFLLICGVLSLWYSAQFGSLPVLDLLPSDGIEGPSAIDPVYYFDLAAGVLLLYSLALAGWFNRAGLSFKPSARGVWQVGSNLVLLAITTSVVGVITGVLNFDHVAEILATNISNPRALLIQALLTFVLIALPQELLFRGTLLPYLQETFQWPEMVVIAASAFIYGIAHWQPDLLSESTGAIWFALLATVCGVFFARAYLASSITTVQPINSPNEVSQPTHPNIATSTVLHTIVRLIWRFAFKA